MKTHARVVVIGGGVVGCSVLYHLARAGWTDVVLLERSELTSGSTWHAAGGMHTVNGDPNVAKLQKYTIGLYKEIEALSGQATGVHLTGGVMLAATQARLDWLRSMAAKGRYLGIQLEEISAKEAGEIMPLHRPVAVRRGGRNRCRRASRPVRRHPRLCQGGTQAGRRGRALHQGRGDRAATRRAVAGVDRQGRHRRRARRQRGWAVGARGRPHGRAGAAGARHGAHVPADRGHARGGGVERQDRHRGHPCHRLRRRALSAPGARRHADGHLREGRPAVVGASHALGLRARAAGAGPRPHRAFAGGRLPAFSGLPEHRHQADHQRPLHLCAGRQPAGRAGARPARLLGRLRRHGRLLAGRRGGAVDRQLDDGRRSRRRHLRHGRRPLRRLGVDGLHQRQGARELFAPLLDPLPERGAAGRAAAQDDADLRPAQRARRAMGRGVRARSAAVVRAARGEGRLLVAPLDRFRACRGRGARGARAGRARRDLQLRQVPGERRGRRRLARPHARLSPAGAGPHDARPHAEGGRAADRRLHARQSGRRQLLHRRVGRGGAGSHALVRGAHAGRRHGDRRGARLSGFAASASPARGPGSCSPP